MNAKYEIPEGWKWVSLGDVCEQDRILAVINNESLTLPTFLGLEDIEANTGRILYKNKIVNNKSSTYYSFTERHVLYGKLRPYLNKVALPTFSGICSTEIIPLLPKKIDRNYLAYLLRNEKVIKAVMQEKTGSRMPRADMKKLLKIKICLPPIVEQKRISVILDEKLETVEAARVAMAKRLEELKILRVAYLKELFPSFGKCIPEGWRWVKINEITQIATGGTPSTNYKEYYGGSIKWMKSGDIIGKYITEIPHSITDLGIKNSNAKIHPVGSVMIALSGQGKTRGTCAILATPSACSQSVAAILPTSEAIPEIIYYNLVNLYQKIRDITGDNERTGLNLKIVGDLQILIPPNDQQKVIASSLSEHFELLDEIEKKICIQLETINSLPQAYLSQAFRGEL